MELVNESLLQKLSKEIFSIPQCENSRSETVSTYLTEDEYNIMRYACGYIGMKLYNRCAEVPRTRINFVAACMMQCFVAGNCC